MKNLYKIIVLLLLIPFISNATERDGKYTKNKVITKEFNVNKNAQLTISNKYGNIGIATWDENRIVIKVSITTNGNDEEKVEKRLEQIYIEFDGNANDVSAKTIIEKNSSSWSLWGRNNNVSMEINYLIQMPVTNHVDLNNDYGAISIDKLEGSSKINCDYGKLTIGELLNSKNSINIDYTNKSTIDFMQDGDIDADYSTLVVERTNTVNLNADYSHLTFGEIDFLDYNCDYGSLKIGTSGNLIGNSDYMHTTIEKLDGSGDFDMDYGSLKINELGDNIKDIHVKSSYTNTKIGVKPSNNFKINATLSYGSLKYGNNFTFNKEIVKSSSKYYEGYYNSSNTNGTITIKSSYGTISFFTN
ncbi:hypothetical protein BX611_1561 [Lutibacter oceani]|uniref:Adhesin n=1 Tax=Lutibacter oceani TaxID=1853311 RepID=A0A3D9RR98_9FLAO|nr:hypothetical protein [Lutibacter oceani]REE82018.1 hypothetical protein BX611_1561 [Lutibacter oceani]